MPYTCCKKHCEVSTHRQHRFSAARTNPHSDDHAYPCIRCTAGEPGQQEVAQDRTQEHS